jgi:hypothetical protein
VASFYFEPAMRVSKGGRVIRATRAEQKAFFDGFPRGLVGRGYSRNAWEDLEVRPRGSALPSLPAVLHRCSLKTSRDVSGCVAEGLCGFRFGHEMRAC